MAAEGLAPVSVVVSDDVLALIVVFVAFLLCGAFLLGQRYRSGQPGLIHSCRQGKRIFASPYTCARKWNRMKLPTTRKN